MAVWLLRTQPLYEPYALWRRMEPPHWPTIAQFARLGIPAALAITVEVTSFTLMSLFIARQGTQAAAAHQIAANLAAVMYMVPLSLAIATSARVSYWMGAGDPKRSRAAIRTGFRIAFAMALFMSATLLLARHGIAAVYTSDAQVLGIAVGLLAVLAVFHLGDAAQAMCVFVLRCYRVTVSPLVAYCVLLWGLGLAGGFVLAYRGVGPIAAMRSPAAFWIAAAAALAVLAFILPTILWRTVRSPRWHERAARAPGPRETRS
jgi:MATE family multidrug resistance protein